MTTRKIKPRTGTDRKADTPSEQIQEARFFARRCGLTTDEALAMIAEANGVRRSNGSKRRNNGGGTIDCHGT
jgi:hypothetical protein